MKVFGFIGPLFLVLGMAAVLVVLDGDVQAWLAAKLGPGCVAFDCGAELRPTGAILALVFLPMGAIFTWVALPSRKAVAKRRATKEQRALATILTMEDSGQRVQGMPYVRFQLQIEQIGNPPQIVATGSVVRKFVQLAPGERIAVLVDPADPGRVRIDWDAA